MDISQLENYIFIAIALIAVATGMKFGGNMLGNLYSDKDVENRFVLHLH